MVPRSEEIPSKLYIGSLVVPETQHDEALTLLKKIYGSDVFHPGSLAFSHRSTDMRCGHLPDELKSFRKQISQLELVA